MTSKPPAAPGHYHAQAVHHRRPVQVRGAGRPARSLPGRARQTAVDRLRVPCHRLGPQGGRRAPRGSRARHPGRARFDLIARPERAAGLRSHQRRHRSAGHRTRAPHPGDHPQGHEEGGHSARAADRSSPPRPGGGWTGTEPGGSSAGSPAAPGWPRRSGTHTLRHAFITAALDAGVPLRDVQEAASHADPRITMRYDRARVSLDRHATYIVAAYIAGAAR